MPECCLWEPGDLSQLWGDTSIVLGIPCVGKKKGKEPLFPCSLAPFIKFVLPWPERVPCSSRVQPPALSAVTPGHSAPGTRTSPQRGQPLVPPTLQPRLPADGSSHSAELSVSPETAAMQDLPSASECASPAGSSLFFSSFFSPEFIPFVLLFLPQPLLLSYSI